MSEQKHAPGTLPIAGQTIHPRVLDRGKYGYAVEYPDGFVSACPSESVARLNAAAPDLLAACLLLLHVEQDELNHGRAFAAGNVARAAIALAGGRQA